MKKIDIVLLVLITIGLIDSIYLLLTEINAVPLYCSTSGLINCAGLLNSTYAVIFGIPLAYYALFWFAVSFVLVIITHRFKKLELARDFWLAVGIGAAAYSLAVMFILKEICEYCFVLDIILVTIFVIMVDKYR